jgi:hypothetical protein
MGGVNNDGDPRGGYKLLLVPAGEIIELTEGLPQTATVVAESSVCNCVRFKAGPFEVVGDVGPDRHLVMSRQLYDTIEVIG